MEECGTTGTERTWDPGRLHTSRGRYPTRHLRDTFFSGSADVHVFSAGLDRHGAIHYP